MRRFMGYDLCKRRNGGLLGWTPDTRRAPYVRCCFCCIYKSALISCLFPLSEHWTAISNSGDNSSPWAFAFLERSYFIKKISFCNNLIFVVSIGRSTNYIELHSFLFKLLKLLLCRITPLSSSRRHLVYFIFVCVNPQNSFLFRKKTPVKSSLFGFHIYMRIVTRVPRSVF